MTKKIALLASENSPALIPIIKEFQRNKIIIHSIILDSKALSERELNRYCDRIGISPQNLELLREKNVQLPVFKVDSHNDKETADLIERIGVDILVNAGTPRILKTRILEAPTMGVINCHPGILPNFRGCSCVEWALYLDEKVGNTIHWMTEEIDKGLILSTEELTFTKSDRYVDIRRKVYDSGYQLLASTVAKLVEDILEAPRSLNEADGKYFEPIPDKLLALVKEKLIAGEYRFQSNSSSNDRW